MNANIKYEQWLLEHNAMQTLDGNNFILYIGQECHVRISRNYGIVYAAIRPIHSGADIGAGPGQAVYKTFEDE